MLRLMLLLTVACLLGACAPAAPATPTLPPDVLQPDNAAAAALLAELPGVGISAFSPDGSTFATLHGGNQLRLYDLNSLSPFTPRLQAITGGIGTLFFLPDGTLMVIYGSTVELRDPTTGDLKVDYRLEEMNWDYVRVSADGSRFMRFGNLCSPGFCSFALGVYAVEDGSVLFSASGDGGFVADAAFSPDSALLAYSTDSTSRWDSGMMYGTSFTDGVLHVIDLAADNAEIVTQTHDNGIQGDLFFNADGTKLLYSVMRWEAQFADFDAARLFTVNPRTGEAVSDVSFGGLAWSVSPAFDVVFADPRLVMPGMEMWSSGGGVYNLTSDEAIYVDGSAPTPEPDSTDTPPGPDVQSLTFSPAAPLAVVEIATDSGSQLTLRDTATWQNLRTLSLGNLKSMRRVIFSPDGKFLVLVYTNTSDQLTLTLWGIAPPGMTPIVLPDATQGFDLSATFPPLPTNVPPTEDFAIATAAVVTEEAATAPLLPSATPTPTDTRTPSATPTPTDTRTPSATPTPTP